MKTQPYVSGARALTTVMLSRAVPATLHCCWSASFGCSTTLLCLPANGAMQDGPVWLQIHKLLETPAAVLQLLQHQHQQRQHVELLE